MFCAFISCQFISQERPNTQNTFESVNSHCSQKTHSALILKTASLNVCGIKKEQYPDFC